MVTKPDADDPAGLLVWATKRINDDWGLGKFLKTGLGLTIAGVFMQLFGLIDAMVEVFTRPLGGLAGGATDLISTLLGAPTAILDVSAAQTAAAITETMTGFLGLLSWPVGVAMTIAGIWLLVEYLQQPTTSDTIPGLFSDIQTPDWMPGLADIGVTEEDENQ